jgi:hypothetical protein
MSTDAEKLAAAEALDRCYAEAEAFDAARAPTRTVYRVNWDNGASACGTFPETYETEDEAQRAATNIEAEMLAQDIWDETGCCEVISVEVPLDPEDEDVDQMAELHKAALNRGQP